MWNVYFTPPSRISREEAEKYNGWLKQKKDNCNAETALVLGATPEIRDILTKFNFKTTIVDINQEMIEAMNSLLKTKNPDEYHITLEITDNGYGIASEDIPHVFEPFFSNKENANGIGLGLAVVHGIVQNHKGKVKVESNLGYGTTMSITFPLIRKYESDR